MSSHRFGKMSPFRAPLTRDDIGVSRPQTKNLEQILLDAENIGNSLMHRPTKETDSPKRQYLLEKAIQRSNIPESPHSTYRPDDSEDLEQKKLRHIEALTEELNMNRKRYEKLLSDHAEEKKHWMMYIKQLEEEKEKTIRKT